MTVPEALVLSGLLRGLIPSLSAIESVKNLTDARTVASLPKIDDAAATALIQYTSGSTGDPKGVVLSHANLLANIRAMFTAIDATSADVLVSWLPLYHDMGLIGAWLAPLYVGARCYIMSPLSFLAHPQSWLLACHRYRGTISAAPNFAFELCLSQIDEADLDGLDLSSLRFVANGAEPVSIHTLRRFIERFSRYGFRASAMAPVYGLAECAVAVALPPPSPGRSRRRRSGSTPWLRIARPPELHRRLESPTNNPLKRNSPRRSAAAPPRQGIKSTISPGGNVRASRRRRGDFVALE